MLKFSELVFGSDVYNFFRSHGEQVASQLTVSECEMLFNYTEMGFKLVNRELVSGEVSDSTMAQVSGLDAVVAKVGKLPRKLTVFRGEVVSSGDVAGAIVSRYPVGGDFTVKQFLSTSLCPSVPAAMLKIKPGFMVVFDTVEGVVLNDFSSAQGLREREVLIGRGQKFIVDRVEDAEFLVGGRKFVYPTVFVKMV